jgi:hypothetical protein
MKMKNLKRKIRISQI